MWATPWRSYARSRRDFVTGQTLHVDGGASLASPDFPMEFQRGA
jgi:hypothetical protein